MAAERRGHPGLGGGRTAVAPYQLGGAATGEDAPGTLDVQVARAPAPHVEPLDGAGRAGAVLAVQEDELLQRAHRRVLQHLLQLQRTSAARRCVVPAGHPPPPAPHLSQRRLLVAQAYDEDAVGLADAAHGPRRQGAVGLVEHDAVDVFLLRQPARQAVLLDAAGMEGSDAARHWVTGDVPPAGSYLSSAEEPSRARMMSLVRSSVGPGRGRTVVTAMSCGHGRHQDAVTSMVNTVPWGPNHHQATVTTTPQASSTLPWPLACHGTVVTTVPWSLPRHGAAVNVISWPGATKTPWTPPCHGHHRAMIAAALPALTDGVKRVLELQREGGRGHVVAHWQHCHR